MTHCSNLLSTAAIIPVVKKQHQLLVTLLLCNACSMEVFFFTKASTLSITVYLFLFNMNANTEILYMILMTILLKLNKDKKKVVGL